MEFEADRMTGLVLTDVNVLPERDVVLEEFNMRVANSPEARIGEQVAAALYLNHPYGRPVIGWRPEIEKLNREDALAFYRRFYTPNNAVVVIAGDVTADVVRPLAEKTYGQVARVAEANPRIRPQEPPPVAVRQVTMADPRVAQPTLQRSYLVPSSTTAKPGEAEALDVLAHVLGNGETSRLYRTLVVDQHVATGAGGWYQGTSLDETRFGVYAIPQPGIAFAGIDDRRRVRLDGVDATPDVHHDGDVVFDEFHRGHHLVDALTGQVLEIAGLEDGNDALLDFLAEDLLLVGRGYLGERGRGVVDRLGGFQNLLGGFFGAADHGAEFAVDLGHFLAVETLAMQHRDFPLGAVDGIGNQVKLDLELLALFDLGAIGFKQRVGRGGLACNRLADGLRCRAAAGAACHLGADGAQFGHDLTLHGTKIAVCDRGRRHIVDKGLFDTKTSAMNRHEIFS